MRNRVPGFTKMLGGFAPNSAHGDAFNFSPLREIGERWLDEASARSLCSATRRRKSILGGKFYIIFADASARSAAFHAVDVHSDFAGETAHVRSGGDGIAVLGAGNFSKL